MTRNVLATQGVNWTAVAAVVTAVGGVLTGALAWVRNRKTDKLSLYSQFVDDLHEEVERLRGQYEKDRERWDAERADFEVRIDELTSEVKRLKRELAAIKAKASRTPGGRQIAAEEAAEELEAELAKVRRELAVLKSHTPEAQRRAARSIIEETMRQMGLGD